jgi:hypothetical protein
MLAVMFVFLATNFTGAFFAVDRLNRKAEQRLVHSLTMRQKTPSLKSIKALALYYRSTTATMLSSQFTKLAVEIPLTLLVGVSVFKLGFFDLVSARGEVESAGLVFSVSILIHNVVDLLYGLSLSINIKHKIDVTLSGDENKE